MWSKGWYLVEAMRSETKRHKADDLAPCIALARACGFCRHCFFLISFSNSQTVFRAVREAESPKGGRVVWWGIGEPGQYYTTVGNGFWRAQFAEAEGRMSNRLSGVLVGLLGDLSRVVGYLKA